MEKKRIEFACRLMRFRPELPVSGLAAQVGYPSDGQYFSKVFRRHCGMTPRDYRKTVLPASCAARP